MATASKQNDLVFERSPESRDEQDSETGQTVRTELPAVYLARHGETPWSLTGQHTGLTDLPLTERGERNARALASRLNGLHFSMVLSSPLQRAARTCALAGFANTAEVDRGLLEWNYGKYEGRRTAEIRVERPDWELFRDGCPGGESPDQVAARADDVLSRVRGARADVLLSSSGHFLRVLAARWLGLAPAAARYLLLSTASLSALGYEHNRAQPVIRLWNDTRHVDYTNHTLLPEALEKWPLRWFEALLPRQLAIIYEINRRLLDSVRTRFPGDDGRVQRVSLIEEGPAKRVRMANLAIVGSHSTNGVAAIHSELLRTTTVRDLAEMFPERFSNKTNGVTPRRWLLLANPALARTITEAIGDGWLTDLGQLGNLKPLAGDKGFGDNFKKAKREAKSHFVDWLRSTASQTVDPDCIFDCQIKRIHEYKRQLLNALRVIVLYNRLREDPHREMTPRTFFFAGKAAPAYKLAKLIIKLLENIAGTIDAEPATRGRLKVLFLPEYDVSLAERLIPASDVSNQISTAGYEASGTSNMKFMMNGALTLGTRDGATIEMAQEAGEENFFLFGLTAEQVANSRAWYTPQWHYEHDTETRAALDLIRTDHFSRYEPGVFASLLDTLLTHGDHYMHLADLTSYLEADQRLRELYADRDAWARMAILNVAASGKFSSDRAIAEYAHDIWDVKPCPVA